MSSRKRKLNHGSVSNLNTRHVLITVAVTKNWYDGTIGLAPRGARMILEVINIERKSTVLGIAQTLSGDGQPVSSQADNPEIW